MSDNYVDPKWIAKTTVPVKRVGERWEFFFGGDVPVKEGTFGELTFSTSQIQDKDFLERVSAELTVKILEEDTTLLVALSDRSNGGNRIGEWPKPSPLNIPIGTTHWERVQIGPPQKKKDTKQVDLVPETGGLWLKIKGLERCELSSSTILLPESFKRPDGISDRRVKSLNHAFTLLSQAYEQHRISNTGNVYTRVFYQDKDDCWYPLNDLRSGVQAKRERQLLYDAWAQIEMSLGWRPVPTSKKRR